MVLCTISAKPLFVTVKHGVYDLQQLFGIFLLVIGNALLLMHGGSGTLASNREKLA